MRVLWFSKTLEMVKRHRECESTLVAHNHFRDFRVHLQGEFSYSIVSCNMQYMPHKMGTHLAFFRMISLMTARVLYPARYEARMESRRESFSIGQSLRNNFSCKSRLRKWISKSIVSITGGTSIKTQNVVDVTTLFSNIGTHLEWCPACVTSHLY